MSLSQQQFGQGVGALGGGGVREMGQLVDQPPVESFAHACFDHACWQHSFSPGRAASRGSHEQA